MTNEISINNTTQKLYCIYRITNILNGKTYIGKRAYSIKDKDDPMGNYWGSGKLLKKAYKKHSREAFRREVLIKDVECKEVINFLEINFIQNEKTWEHHGEYNIAHGGDGGDTLTNHPDRERIISKFSHPCPEWKKERQRQMRGEKSPLYGRKCSEEHRRNSSIAHKGLQVGEKNGMYGKGYLLEGRKRTQEEIQHCRNTRENHLKEDPHYYDDAYAKTAEANRKPKSEEFKHLFKQRGEAYQRAKREGVFTGTWNEFQTWCKQNQLLNKVASN